jgi:hypothetical protein
MIKYPTEWSYGIPRGSIRDRNTSIRLEINSGKKKYNETFIVSKFKSKKECLKHVEKIRLKKSHELDLTRNEIRFLDENTIEVKLTQNKKFITDAINLKLVNKYPLQAKAKHEKGITRYYVMAQDKKKVFKFTNLLNNYKIVEYVNGKTFDLRKINMKEFGLEYNIAKDEKSINEDTIEDFTKYYHVEINELPKNKWISGSIPGTIFFRKNEKNKILTMRIKELDGQMRCKTFKVSDHGTVENTIKKAKKYMINVAHKIDVVRNKIKIYEDYFEIMVDKENIMKTNLIFLPLFVPTFDNLQLDLTVCKTFSQGSNKIYAAAYIKGSSRPITFHKFIMGSPMIDHINSDPLDNRLENLRFTNYSQNNTNKISNSETEVTGVTYSKGKTGEFYCAKMKNNGITYCKNFSISRYGENAKYLAEKYRKNILEINFQTNIEDIPLTKNDIIIIENSIKRTSDYQTDMLKRMVIDPNKYLFCLDGISTKTKKDMHKYYLKLQSWRYILLETRIGKLTKCLNNLKSIPKNNIIEV